MIPRCDWNSWNSFRMYSSASFVRQSALMSKASLYTWRMDNKTALETIRLTITLTWYVKFTVNSSPTVVSWLKGVGLGGQEQSDPYVSHGQRQSISSDSASFMDGSCGKGRLPSLWQIHTRKCRVWVSVAGVSVAAFGPRDREFNAHSRLRFKLPGEAWWSEQLITDFRHVAVINRLFIHHCGA